MRRGRTIYHCHGKSKGKVLRKYRTVAAAKRAHRGMRKRKK